MSPTSDIQKTCWMSDTHPADGSATGLRRRTVNAFSSFCQRSLRDNERLAPLRVGREAARSTRIGDRTSGKPPPMGFTRRGAFYYELVIRAKGLQICGKSSFSNKPRICCPSCRSVFCLRPRLRRISPASPIHSSKFTPPPVVSNQRMFPLASIPTRTCCPQPPGHGRTAPHPPGKALPPLCRSPVSVPTNAICWKPG